LSVDHELETVNLKKKLFFKIARNTQDYVKDVIPRDDFIMKLAERGIDVFTFAERKWCSIISHPPRLWLKTEENIALLQIASYEDWWKNVGKKTRNMVRKAEKSGIKTEVVETNEKLVEGIWKIYNETPIRQERAFPHYGLPLQTVRELVFSVQNCTFIGSFLQNELVGFIQLIHGDKTAIISQILSLQKHWDKAVNNALIAKAMKFCASNKIEWVMYGRMGNHPSLDKFKESNSFSKFTIARYYIPITWKGKLAVKLGLHREIKDVVPERLKHWLIPLYNWTSRNMRIR